MDDFSELSKAQSCSDVYPETSVFIKIYFEGTLPACWLCISAILNMIAHT